MSGRLLSEEVIEAARRIAVINEAMARNYYKDDKPIGKTIKFNELEQVQDLPRDTYFEIGEVISLLWNAGFS